jgi:hypothetical protein
MKNLPWARYVVVDVYLSGGQTVRFKCKSFNVKGRTDHVSEWEYEGAKTGNQVWFCPKDIIAWKIVRRTWL